MVGDSIFLIGVGAFTAFVVGLKLGWSYAPPATQSDPAAIAPQIVPGLTPVALRVPASGTSRIR